MDKVRAKFICDSVTDHGSNKEVKMSAVYSDEGENKDFADASPYGSFYIGIDDGRPASDFFKPGKEYYLDIQEAPKG